MFLDAYKRNWLETEGYSFEDKMIDDLSVSPLISETCYWLLVAYWPQCIVIMLSPIFRKPWRKRRKRKRRPRQSLTPFTSWFFISAAQLSQKRRKLLLRLNFVTCSSVRPIKSCNMLSPYSKLDVDHLYMSYADIMAKVRLLDVCSSA